MRELTSNAIVVLMLAGAFAAPVLCYDSSLLEQTGGKEMSAKVVAAQKAFALEGWKRAFAKEDPLQRETEHFLLYGKAPIKGLETVGAYLEKVYATAGKVLDLSKQQPWRGKMAVFLIPEERDYRATVRAVARLMPEDEERGRFLIRAEASHAIVSPGVKPSELPLDLQAGVQVASALIAAKGGDTVPVWVIEGFGRASAFRAASAAQQSAERRRAYAAAVPSKRSAADAWVARNLGADEAALLRASVIDYLAYSGRVTRFLPFLTAFRPQEKQPTPTTETALNAANIAPDKLNAAWQQWVRTLK